MSIQTHPIIARGFLPRAALLTAVTSLCSLGLTDVWAAGERTFRVYPAKDYPARQGEKNVTAAVKPYVDEREVKQAFGKAKPLKYGFVPVLVVITNDSDDAYDLKDLKVRFVTSDREGLDPMSAEDLKYFQPNSQPKDRPRYIPPLPGLNKPRVKKGPLAKSSITEREFKAPVIAPHSSVSGFFYYGTGTQPDPIPGAAIYLSGIRNLRTGQELFYFEIPLDPYGR